jgi:hypothetical protein
MVSKPLLGWTPWAIVGMGLAILTQFRGPLADVLTRLSIGRVAGEAQEPADASLQTSVPILASFLHRNYALHVTGLLALLGADRLGSLALLGLGACVDSLREQWAVSSIPALSQGRPVERPVNSGKWASGTWTSKQMLIACGIIVGTFAGLCGGFSVLPATGPTTTSWLAAFNHVLVGVAPVRHGIPGVPSIEIERVGLIMSMGDLFVLVVTLFVTWGTTSRQASVARKYVLFPSSALSTLLALGSIALTYFFAIVLESPGFIHSREQFERADAASWLFGMFLFIAFLCLGYYGVLTSLRFHYQTDPR